MIANTCNMNNDFEFSKNDPKIYVTRGTNNETKYSQEICPHNSKLVTFSIKQGKYCMQEQNQNLSIADCSNLAFLVKTFVCQQIVYIYSKALFVVFS